MSPKHPTAAKIPVSKLNKTSDTPILLEPNAEKRSAIAEELGALGLKKLRFDGEILPEGKKGWKLQASLGATVVQACIVTLEPVTTRIDTKVTRSFVPEHLIDLPEAGSETEIPDEDEIDVLGEEIDVEAVMIEALSLALPTYPRKDGAEMETGQFSAEGVTPMRDEDTRPFAGLASLREKMQKDGDDS